jgi:hypothetical protein
VPELTATAEHFSVLIEIGGVPVRVNTTNAEYRGMLEERYAGFTAAGGEAEYEFDVNLSEAGFLDPDADVQVTREAKGWSLRRGDFLAEWEPELRRGRIRQTPNPYSIDSVLRIIHTLVLAREGGFLVHSASAVRNGKAFLFSGVSGAGKTTISRLAPPDVAVLTDEISYVRKSGEGYTAYGTPFAGELARAGENISAPLAALYLLRQGPENRIEPVGAAEAVRALLGNILFFAEDAELVRMVFQAACEFVAKVPVRRLTFLPNSSAWDEIG